MPLLVFAGKYGIIPTMKLKNLFSKKDMGNADAREIIRGNRIEAGPLTIADMERVIKNRESVALAELDRGYQLIKKYPRTVSILGSARFAPTDKYYKHAESVARRIVTELKYAIVTGGGPGIMEAANKGAYEANGVSIGFTIQLPKEQKTNPYVNASADFKYFFNRQTLLFFAAEAYIYYPGGFGTFDELFSLVTSIQTKKIQRTPVILVGSEFWMPFMKVIKQKLFVENSTIGEEDMSIYTVVDSEDEIINIIKKAPYRQE